MNSKIKMLEDRIDWIAQGNCTHGKVKHDYNETAILAFENFNPSFKFSYEGKLKQILKKINNILSSSIIKNTKYKVFEFTSCDDSGNDITITQLEDFRDSDIGIEDCYVEKEFDVSQVEENENNYREELEYYKSLLLTLINDDQEIKKSEGDTETRKVKKVKKIIINESLKKNLKVLFSYKDDNGNPFFRDMDNSDTQYQLDFFLKNGTLSSVMPQLVFHFGVSLELVMYLFHQLHFNDLIIKQYPSAIVNSILFKNSEGNFVNLRSLINAKKKILLIEKEASLPKGYQNEFRKINELIQKFKSKPTNTSQKVT